MMILTTGVYTYAEFFIEKNPNGHFIFDEVPMLRKKDGSFGRKGDSVKRAEQFVLNCHRLIPNDKFLWFAFQPNAFADVTDASNDYFPSFSAMKNLLEERGFHLASLGSNMRNTREISKVTLRHEDHFISQAKAYISKLKSSVTGKTPRHIPILDDAIGMGDKPKLKQALFSMSTPTIFKSVSFP